MNHIPTPLFNEIMIFFEYSYFHLNQYLYFMCQFDFDFMFMKIILPFYLKYDYFWYFRCLSHFFISITLNNYFIVYLNLFLYYF